MNKKHSLEHFLQKFTTKERENLEWFSSWDNARIKKAIENDVSISGKSFDSATVHVPNNERAIDLANSFAIYQSQHPQILQIARVLLEAGIRAQDVYVGQARAIAEGYHRLIKHAVKYQDEAVETFRSPVATLTLGSGDCDDHAILFVALCRATGVPARVVGLRNSKGHIRHAVGQAFHDGDWHWAETTIDARYGEHPKEAAKRLGISTRTDING